MLVYGENKLFNIYFFILGCPNGTFGYKWKGSAIQTIMECFVIVPVIVNQMKRKLSY
jgi:hypothetical protein